jgi:large subunit ribosomal protein L24
MARHIKTGDQVMVTTGADKGKTGRVLRIISGQNRVVVEGINRVWKHVRPSQRTPQGGRIQKDAPIHLSNVMPLDPTTGKGTRVKFEEKDGVKHRVAIKSGADLGPTGKKATNKNA